MVKAEEGCYKSSELKNEESGIPGEGTWDNWCVYEDLRKVRGTVLTCRILSTSLITFP